MGGYFSSNGEEDIFSDVIIDNLSQEGNGGAVDLIRIVEAKAQAFLMKTGTLKQKQIPPGNLAYKTDWSKMKIAHQLEYANDPLNPDRGLETTLLAQQEYQNNTGGTIQHTFSFERQTKCVGTVSLETGVYCSDSGLEITMPEYKENPAAGKFPRSVTLGRNGTLSKTLEETITWSQSSVIPIAPRKTVLATLSVLEQERNRKFTITTTMVGGPLVVKVSDNATQEFVTSMQFHLSEIMRGVRNLPGVHIEGKTVTFVTSGTSYFKYGVRTKEEANELGNVYR